MNDRKRLFHRRTLLRGAGGVAVALPFLESFASRQALANPIKRFGVYFQCSGINMDRWWPEASKTGSGMLTADLMKGTALEPLTRHASRILVPRGIAMAPRGYGLDRGNGCDHKRGMSQKLTCSLLSGERPQGPSIDYTIAKAINPGQKDPLVFGTGGAGNGSNALSSAFYKPSGQKADFQKDPARIFAGWMGQGTPTGTNTVDLTLQRRKSVLDVIRDDLKALQSDAVIGKEDQAKLDMHFQAIRRLEMDLGSGAGQARPAQCKDAPAAPANAASSFERTTLMMLDLIALGMACDINRVISLQMDAGAGGPVYNWLPDKQNKVLRHHPLSHGATSDAIATPNLPTAEWKTALFNIDTWHQKMMGHLLDRLSSYREGAGTVLDNSVILYMNELSNGLSHSFTDLPVLVAGSGGGKLKQGQFIKMTTGSTGSGTECPTNQLFVTLAHAVGMPQMTNFGPFNNGKSGPFNSLFR